MVGCAVRRSGPVLAAAVLGVLAGLQLSAPFLERTLVEVMEVIYSYNIIFMTGS